ncbi:unnamed protein product [Rhizoctonia solani]|uniref:Uncharacterized protein n=1 Tax=Rhizoctonia solani TaxID=456999 RepID=A0A8H3C5W4_9AGAM|nr:unnamed protein product [Rhizoctonia solani]
MSIRYAHSSRDHLLMPEDRGNMASYLGADEIWATERSAQKSQIRLDDSTSKVASLEGTNTEKILAIVTLVTTLSAALKVSVMNLAKEVHMLDKDQSEKMSVVFYQVYLLGLTD